MCLRWVDRIFESPRYPAAAHRRESSPLEPGKARFQYNNIVVHAHSPADALIAEKIGLELLGAGLAGHGRGLDVGSPPNASDVRSWHPFLCEDNLGVLSQVARVAPPAAMARLAGTRIAVAPADPGTLAKLDAAYAAAVEGGAYDALPYPGGTPGKMRRAWGMRSARDYTAELAEAFFGRNDNFPNVREELISFDPAGCASVAELWMTQCPAP